MSGNILKKLIQLPLEEKILNGAALAALIGVFAPWISGEWLGGETVSFSGFGFYTSFIGIMILILNVFLLLITLVPMTGGHAIVKRRNKAFVRLLISSQSAILVLAGLSVLTKFTLEFSRMEIRFGIYLSLAGSLVSALYSFLIKQEDVRSEVKDLFHQSGQSEPDRAYQSSIDPPPPPPPPAPPEEHRMHR